MASPAPRCSARRGCARCCSSGRCSRRLRRGAPAGTRLPRAHAGAPHRPASCRRRRASSVSPAARARFVAQPIRYTALAPDGRALPVSSRRDPNRGRDSRVFRARCRQPGRLHAFAGAGRGVSSATLFARTPPDLDDPGRQDLWTVMRTAGAFRALAEGRPVAAAAMGTDGGGGPGERGLRDRAAERGGGRRWPARRDARARGPPAAACSCCCTRPMPASGRLRDAEIEGGPVAAVRGARARRRSPWRRGADRRRGGAGARPRTIARWA